MAWKLGTSILNKYQICLYLYLNQTKSEITPNCSYLIFVVPMLRTLLLFYSYLSFNFPTCVWLRRFEMYLCDCLTSWQYCSTPSLVPTQLLVPDGSGSQRPVWMLTCMLSFPQNIATCGSATANPVPALAASACRKTDREKCQLMQSVIIQPIKAGECTCWQIWDTVCSTCFSHKYHYEIQHRNLVIWSLNT